MKSFHKFLQTNFNTFLRSAPDTMKKRKFEHIEIQKDFEKMEEQQRLKRLDVIEYKKSLKKKHINLKPYKNAELTYLELRKPESL